VAFSFLNVSHPQRPHHDRLHRSFIKRSSSWSSSWIQTLWLPCSRSSFQSHLGGVVNQAADQPMGAICQKATQYLVLLLSFLMCTFPHFRLLDSHGVCSSSSRVKNSPKSTRTSGGGRRRQNLNAFFDEAPISRLLEDCQCRSPGPVEVSNRIP
jgi:hypothetical protein